MKIVIAQACGRELIQRRHFTRAAKRTRLSKADIVEQDDDDVWCPLRRLDLKARRRLSVARVKFRDSWRLGLGNRKHRAVKSVRGLSQSRGRGDRQPTGQHEVLPARRRFSEGGS